MVKKLYVTSTAKRVVIQNILIGDKNMSCNLQPP